MRLFGVLLGLLIAIGLPSSAIGQNLAVRDQEVYVAKPKESAAQLKAMSRCVSDRNPGYVTSMLAARPGSYVENRIFEKISNVMVNCSSELNVDFPFTPGVLVNKFLTRGAFAEELYLKEYSTDPEVFVKSTPIVPLAADWISGQLSVSEQRMLLQQDFVRCVVSADPIHVSSLLRTQLGSPEEASVIAEIRPYLGPCLHEGVTLEVDPAMLRSLLAEGLYQSVNAWDSARRRSSIAGS